jgi:Rrf2 family protein
VRLEITRKTDLALQALRVLAADPVTWKSDELAAAIGTTPGFLSQALAPLVRARWVHSAFGPGGGYRWAEPPDPPSLLDAIVAIEGPLRESECVLHNRTSCAVVTGGPVCALHEGWLRARVALLDVLSSTSALATTPAPSSDGRNPAPLPPEADAEALDTTVPARPGGREQEATSWQ